MLAGHAFVRFARAVDIEVTQANDDPIRRFMRRATREVVHDRFRKRVNIGGGGAVCFHARVLAAP